jgi:hypothetical protein
MEGRATGKWGKGISEISNYFQMIKAEDAKPGDIAIFRHPEAKAHESQGHIEFVVDPKNAVTFGAKSDGIRFHIWATPPDLFFRPKFEYSCPREPLRLSPKGEIMTPSWQNALKMHEVCQ